MPVDTAHPEYAQLAPLWRIARDVTDGEYTIKRRSTDYLPMLAGMDQWDYRDYLLNARFYNVTGRTVQGLLGSAFRVPPHVEVYPAMELWLPDITLSGLLLEALLKKDVEDKLQTGRYGFRVDYSEEQRRPYLAYYGAENAPWWHESIIDGHRVLDQVRLREMETLPGEDEFEWIEKEVYHVLDLVNGQCRARKFRKVDQSNTWSIELLPPPTRQGVPLNFIPFVFDGVSDTTPSCEKPPLMDLMAVNLGHYRLTADYYDAIRFTSKPQPWTIGAGTSTPGQEGELRIGSRHAWMLPAGASPPGYLEYSGVGISDIRQALVDDESRSARLGAAVLEEPKEGVESAETSRINQSGKTSLLASITGTTGQAATIALRMMSWWAGLSASLDDPNIQVKMNQDFIESRMTPQDLLALVTAWQQRGISRQTLTYNVKRGGLLPDNVTEDDEIELIESEAPPMPTGPGEDLDEEPEEEEAA